MKPQELEALREQFVSIVANMAKPVDHSDLERRGTISKAGAWYRVHVPIPDLPKHVADRIYEFAQDSKGIKVKFIAESKVQRSVKKLKRMGFGVARKSFRHKAGGS